MQNFIRIITEPDNIAIVIMMVEILTCSLSALREMILNDRAIKEGKKGKVYERMTS